MNGQHPLCIAVEGDLEHLGEGGVDGVRAAVAEDRAATRQDRNLSGGALEAARRCGVGLRGRVEDTAPCEGPDVDLAAAREGVSDGRRENAVAFLDGHCEVRGGHLAGGQGAGLVAAQDADTAEGLDRVDLADQDVALRHLPGGDHQADRDRGQQPLGHLREEGRGRVRQDLREVPLVRRQDVGDQGQATHGHGDVRDDVDEVFDLDLQGGPRPRRADLGRDLAQQRIVAGAEHQSKHPPLDHGGSAEGHVTRLHQRLALGGHICRPRLGHGLARERRVVDERAVGAGDDAEVCRHLLSSFELDDVSRNEVISQHLQLHADAVPHAVAGHRGRRRHLLQSVHHALSLHLHIPLQRRRCNNHAREHHRRDFVVAAQDEGQEELASDADPQHDIEEPAEDLLQKQHPLALALWRSQLVLPELQAPLGDGALLEAQTGPRGCAHRDALQGGAQGLLEFANRGRVRVLAESMVAGFLLGQHQSCNVLTGLDGGARRQRQAAQEAPEGEAQAGAGGRLLAVVALLAAALPQRQHHDEGSGTQSSQQGPMQFGHLAQALHAAEPAQVVHRQKGGAVLALEAPPVGVALVVGRQGGLAAATPHLGLLQRGRRACRCQYRGGEGRSLEATAELHCGPQKYKGLNAYRKRNASP
mmetsp:Transcript_118031/g.376332  ORF Transcript_118031/g.376332 Transcript_118031/m.376332 type:complete len:645 (+) Transcript_118031:1641-3575(+)